MLRNLQHRFPSDAEANEVRRESSAEESHVAAKSENRPEDVEPFEPFIGTHWERWCVGHPGSDRNANATAGPKQAQLERDVGERDTRSDRGAGGALTA